MSNVILIDVMFIHVIGLGFKRFPIASSSFSVPIYPIRTMSSVASPPVWNTWNATANPYGLPGDFEKIKISQQYGLSTGTINRYRDKGLPQWEEFLKSRGWKPHFPYTNLFLDHGSEQFRLSDQQRTELVLLFTVYLREKGLEPYDYVLALRKDFENVGANVAMFEAQAVMVAKSRIVPQLARERATTKLANQRQTVTAVMLRRCYEEDIVPLPPLVDCPLEIADYYGAICIGFCMYNFGKRVGQFAKTAPDKVYLEQQRSIESMVRGLSGFPAVSSLSLSTSNLVASVHSVDSRLLMDPHCIRAMDVIFTSKRRSEFVRVSADALATSDLVEKNYPLEVSLTFYTSKADQNGDRPETYIIEFDSSPGEKALVRMLWHWAWYGRYSNGLDIFFSRPSGHISDTNGRKRLRQGDVNLVAKFCAAAEKISPSGFSTNSFKTGGYSRQLREEGQESEDTPNATLIQRRLTGYFGHRSISAAKHYQRPTARYDGPLSKVWTNMSRDNQDQLDLLDNLKLGAGTKPDSDQELVKLLADNRKRIKTRNSFLRSWKKDLSDSFGKRARLTTTRLTGVGTYSNH